MVQVANLRTASGGYAANQFKIWTDEGVVFQSYQSIIAERLWDGEVTLYEPYWNMYSVTTNRYLLQFLNEDSIKDVRAKVKSGEYKVE
tara:strand:- start:250 stop:513 length:264 start_codon:yes stop_codon:yes gene_type:complete